MSTAEIYTRLTPVFRNVFDDDHLVPTAEMTAASVPGWDSMSHINLIVATESAFRIKFKTAELESLRDVGRLVDVIASKVS